MNVITKKRILNFSLDVLTMLSIFIGIYCLGIKLYTLPKLNSESINILAARFVFFRGNFNFSNIFKKSSLKETTLKKEEASIEEKKECYDNLNNSKEISNFKLPEIKDIFEEEPHSENEKQCPIIEKHIGAGGTKCENFYVKNSTGHEINLNEYLNKAPEIKITNTDKPQVLIMHTHTSEAYTTYDKGFFYESFYPRSLDNNKNVTQVGKAITESLIKNGINTIHSTVYHDNPTYNGSYSRAAKTITKILEENPSIQVVIDIHRDSLGTKETGKVKPTFEFQGKKASQLMIISGCDVENSNGFPNWEKNLILALKLQKYCESIFPGITRPLNFAKVKYNEHLTPGSLLIEVGSDVNTLQESIYTGAMLGEALSRLLNDLKK